MNIRKMTEADRGEVMDMMRVFYNSEAVLSNGSDAIFSNDICTCISDSPFLEGYIMDVDGAIAGYGMLARSYSTEFGKPCVWVEDIYIKEEYRANGIAGSFLRYVAESNPDCILRLEAERENETAVKLYEICGFREIPYLEMINLNEGDNM